MAISGRPPLEERIASLRAGVDAAQKAQRISRFALHHLPRPTDGLSSLGIERSTPIVASPREIALGNIAAQELPHEVPLPPYPLEDPYTGTRVQI